MIQINDSLLQEIGLGSLPQTEKRGLLNHIYETLELRVGMRLADQMTNEQLDEFERYFEAKDDKGAFAWLETNFPNYKEIVQQEFDKLKAEVAQSAPQILAAASAQAAQPNDVSTTPPAATIHQPQISTTPQSSNDGLVQPQQPPMPQTSPMPPIATQQPPLDDPGLQMPTQPPAGPGV